MNKNTLYREQKYILVRQKDKANHHYFQHRSMSGGNMMNKLRFLLHIFLKYVQHKRYVSYD